MVISVKRVFVLVILALALLAGLVGWSMRMIMLPAMPTYTSVHSTHVLADGPDIICPPPPRIC